MADSENKKSDSTPSVLPWVTPFIVYMLLLTLDSRISTNPYAYMPESSRITPVRLTEDEKKPDDEVKTTEQENEKAAKSDKRKSTASSVDPNKYLILTALRVLIVGGMLFWWWKVYLSQFEFRIGWMWLPVGVIGFLAWIGLCHLNLEQKLLSLIGLPTEWLSTRAAFNPTQAFSANWLMVSFLFARFSLMVLAIPLAEEIFLRGFLVRFVDRPDWWNAPLNTLKWLALMVVPAYAVLTHPSEAFAAIVWFSMVTFLMIRSNNIWPCVLAHATTNLLLGIYVVSFGQWQLW